MTSEGPISDIRDDGEIRGDRFDVGGYVAKARRIADLSQRELAELVGVQQATVARWETETRPMTVVALDQVLRLAGLQLAVVDEAGAVVTSMPADAVRDNAGRRFPAHLDVAPPDQRPSNRGAGPRYDRAEPQGWYALRSTRDRVAGSGGERPHDHPTVSELADRRDARRASRATRWGPPVANHGLAECTCADDCFEQPACGAGCACQCESRQRESRQHESPSTSPASASPGRAASRVTP